MLYRQQHLQESIKGACNDLSSWKHGLCDSEVVEHVVDGEGRTRIIGSKNEAKGFGQAINNDAVGAREAERFRAIGAGIVWVCMR